MFLHGTIPNPCLWNQILLKFLSSAMRNSHLGFYPFLTPKSQSIFPAFGKPCRQELLSFGMQQCNETVPHMSRQQLWQGTACPPCSPPSTQPFMPIACSHISLPSWPQLVPQRNKNTPEITIFLGAVNCSHAQRIGLLIKCNISPAWTPMPYSQLEMYQNLCNQEVSFRLKPK